MTRETKIGLLVGLAFIIVIGILLSDHMTSTTEPPKAPLSVAGNNVRESVVTPAASHVAPPVAAVGGNAAGGTGAITPNQPVMTGADLSPPVRVAQPTIQVGPATPQTQPPVVVSQGPVMQPQSPVQAPVQTTAPQPPVVIAQPPTVGHPLQQVAGRHGEQIIPVGETGDTPVQPPVTVRPQPVPMAPLREYKAQSGDSLSRLAARFMGSASKANRDAIIRVNPTLQQNPDKIVEGRTYIIPPAPPVEVAAQPAPAAPAAPAPAAPASRGGGSSEAQAASSERFSWYTVKENENLWKIAAEQLGSGNAWTQIRDLNQDILKGEDQVRSNTRIRLPNKPVASAAH